MSAWNRIKKHSSFTEDDLVAIKEMIVKDLDLPCRQCVDPIKDVRESIIVHIAACAVRGIPDHLYGEKYTYLHDQIGRMVRFLPIEEIERWDRELAEESVAEWKRSKRR